MKNKTITILMGIMVLVITTLIAMLILSQLRTEYMDYVEEQCSELNGEVITYECYNSLVSDCSKLKTGIWCRLPNGEEMQFYLNVSN